MNPYRDKPPLISEGERQSAYYNIACCHSRLNNNDEGIKALLGIMAKMLTMHKLTLCMHISIIILFTTIDICLY